AYMQIEYEAREVDLKNKPQSLLDFSPKGTVPVLILPDGKILEESLDIIFWAMSPPTITDRILINEIIAINDNDFKIHNYQYKYGNNVGSERTECERFIKLLEQKLSKNIYLINDN